MMKKIFLLLTMLTAVNIVALAEDNHLYIQSNAGEKQDWNIPSLQKMTFQNGNVVLTSKLGETAYIPISSISRIYICTPSANGIGGVVGQQHAQYEWDGETLQVNVTSGSSLRVYNTSGITVFQQYVAGESAVVDLRWLERGLYIVNMDGQTFKIIKR